MAEKQKAILAIVSTLTVVGLSATLLLPLRNVNKSLDFFIQDSSANNQLEVNESLKFIISDSVAIVDKRVLRKTGNDDSIIGKPNISYVYKQAGKYLITPRAGSKAIAEETIDIVKIIKGTTTVDFVPKIVGPTQGYAGERLVFPAGGDGMTGWFQEFSESGAIDTLECQVVYKYDEPGRYLIKLKTNTTLYPVFHAITILPEVEDIIENPADEANQSRPEPIDTLAMVQNGIKKHLQAIANAGARDKEAFYVHRSFVINNYLDGNGSQVVVHINGERYNVFPDYCRGLHFPESNRYGRMTIDDVEVDDFHHITRIKVTQKSTGK